MSFRRSWVWLELPVAAVILTSAALLAAIVMTDDAYEVLRKLFDKVNPGVEASTGTWVNAGLWLMTGLVAGYIALHEREHRKSWAVVSGLGIYFSLDETVMLHEHLNGLLADFEPLQSFANFVWVIPGTVLALLIAGLLLRMVLSLPHKSRNGILAGGAVFVFGSIGVESISGFVHVQQGGGSNAYDALRIVEEALEMTGVALTLAAMLHLLERCRAAEATAYRVNVQREAGSRAAR
uniref:Uncharacterized protein n=1 Tax=Kocuria rosea subsp. polaris TaxID=136273 RepID=A0A0A6VQY2_KOCRO|nr:hypothetical protein GY22_10555 [Kocuria polaris]